MKHTVKTILLATSLCLPLLAATVKADETTGTETPIEVVSPSAPIEVSTEPVIAPVETTVQTEPVIEVPTTPISIPEAPIEVPATTEAAVETTVSVSETSEAPKPTETTVAPKVEEVTTIAETTTVSSQTTKAVETTTQSTSNAPKQLNDKIEKLNEATKTTSAIKNDEVTATPKPVTTTVINQPLVTTTGQTIVGTQDSQVIVQQADGTTRLVAPEVVGAKKQSDGTVLVKTKDGKTEVLPSTGEQGSVVVTTMGVFSLIFALVFAAKERLNLRLKK